MLHLRYAGTDTALMIGIVHTLVSEGLHDQAFLERYTEGWPVFLRYLTGETDGKPKDAEWAARMSAGLNDTELLAREQFCYLTTVGRKSGRPHTVEIWYAVRSSGATLYILSGGGYNSDWVKNIRHNSATQVRVGDRTFNATGRVVSESEEELLARRLVVAKYYGRDQLASSGWEAPRSPMSALCSPSGLPSSRPSARAWWGWSVSIQACGYAPVPCSSSPAMLWPGTAAAG